MSDNIEILTFTGVDTKTDMERLQDIQNRYPRVEFGILIGSNTSHGQDNGIFPPWQAVLVFRDICRLRGTRCAIHLCGSHARSVMQHNDPSGQLMALCSDFSRVQVNLHGDFWYQNDVEVNGQLVMNFAEKLTDGRGSVETVILQHREGFANVPLLHDRVEYLFDQSGGAGVAAFDKWPYPSALRRTGYAGGLGPHNIHWAIKFAKEHSRFPLWFDMESNIRKDGWLDLDAVEDVCGQVFDS